MAITLAQRPLSIPTNGLILKLDAADTASYPGTGTVWYDTSGLGNHFNIVATAYNSTGAKYMDFNGTYGCAKRSPDMPISSKNNAEATYVVWTRVKNSTTEWRTLTRALTVGGDHNVIIEAGSWNIGMYDGNNGSGFNGTGFSQQSIPGNGTTTWAMLTFRFNTSAPYFTISYNDTPETIRGYTSSINSSMKYGICSIGGYNNGDAATLTNSSQYWGDIGAFFVYNRILTNSEVLQCYNSGANRFMGAAAQNESIITFSDGSVQGSAFTSTNDTGNLLEITTFSATGTWTKPARCGKVIVKVVAGGGGAASYCESGGGGGYSEKVIDVTAVSTVAVTVGGGGAAVGYYAAAPQGGTSSFGSYCSATGGYGANQNASHTGGHGGVGSAGDVNFLGGCGTGHGNTGGREAVGAGGGTYWGSSRMASHSQNTPVGFAAPGSGGVGGAMQGWVGSAGASGLVVVYSYA